VDAERSTTVRHLDRVVCADKSNSACRYPEDGTDSTGEQATVRRNVQRRAQGAASSVHAMDEDSDEGDRGWPVRRVRRGVSARARRRMRRSIADNCP
jgi:hypothetical protein